MAEVPFQISPAFAVPFVQTMMPSADALNPKLKALFSSREAEGSAYANIAPTMQIDGNLFESRFDLFHWEDPDVVTLREFCTAAVFRAVAELNGYDRERLARLRMSADAWFHITRPGGQFGMHNHPMATWSGIYCVDSGYPDGAPVESARVQFMHPVPGAGAFSDMSVANMRAPWSNRHKEIALQAGQLVLFPSWLMHQVLPYRGKGERVTVAFNAWFKELPEPS